MKKCFALGLVIGALPLLLVGVLFGPEIQARVGVFLAGPPKVIRVHGSDLVLGGNWPDPRQEEVPVSPLSEVWCPACGGRATGPRYYRELDTYLGDTCATCGGSAMAKAEQLGLPVVRVREDVPADTVLLMSAFARLAHARGGPPSLQRALQDAMRETNGMAYRHGGGRSYSASPPP